MMSSEVVEPFEAFKSSVLVSCIPWEDRAANRNRAVSGRGANCCPATVAMAFPRPLEAPVMKNITDEEDDGVAIPCDSIQ